MHEAAIELMQILAKGINENEAFADQLGAIAADARAAGDEPVATTMSALARNHRIRALELHGRLAATSMVHSGIFHQHLAEE